MRVQRDAIAPNHIQSQAERSNGLSPDQVAPRRDQSAESEQTDRELVRRLHERDGEALATLYDRYAPTVNGLARGILRDARLAEEATHDVFLGLWQNPGGYDASRGPFAGWLFRVARNRAIDLFRRRREQPFAATPVNDQGETIDPTTFLIDGDPDPADQAIVAIQREAVRRGLRELSLDHQQLLQLAYFTGMTQSEIALHLGRPLGTVKTQIRSAMKKLSEVLSESAPMHNDVADLPIEDSTNHPASRVSHTGEMSSLDSAAQPLYGDISGDSSHK
jgi:RNA polymerase sigma-70 factor, ECF subfamily